MKKFLILHAFLISFLFSAISFAAEIKYTCNGWISFVFLNSDRKPEDKQYFLRVNPDNSNKEIIRDDPMKAQNAMVSNLSNDMMIFAKAEGKTPKPTEYTRPKVNKSSFVQVLCWREGVDKTPDLSDWPKDNTGRKANSTLSAPKPPQPKDDSSVLYSCTQRLVYYLLGQSPADRENFVYYGKKDLEDLKNGKVKYVKYPGPKSAAQGKIREHALDTLKAEYGANIMLVDDPPATCIQ